MCAVFALNLGVNYKKMRLECDINVKAKVQDLQDYAPQIREVSEEYRYIYVDKSAKRLKPLQLIFKEFQVYVRSHIPEESAGNYFIISMPDNFNEKIDRTDCYRLADFDYENAEYYVIYVKGEALREELENMGHKLLKIEAD